MAFSLSGSITGTSQSGFTGPTYTVVADTPPNYNAKQWAVSALGGTQAGVIPHSVSAPFTVAMFRPQILQVLAPVDPVTGILRKVGVNTYKVITRKGVIPLAGQAYKPMTITTMIEVPAGADAADSANVKAALSCHLGAVFAQSSGIGDTVLTGTL